MPDLKMKFDSPVTVIDLTADLANNAVAGGTTLFDNSTLLYPFARAVLHAPATFGGIPTNNSVVNLYAVLQDVDGTQDETSAPTGTDIESARFMGAFVIYDTDEEQRVSTIISLEGIEKAFFYIENKAGVAITGTGSNIFVKVTPFTYSWA